MSTVNSIASNIRFSVGLPGIGLYQTIQAAITAAEAAGGGTVFIHPGSYTENLVFTTGTVQLIGFNAGSYVSGAASNITITGIHVPPTTGIMEARNIFFQTATDVFASNAAGSAVLILEQCGLDIDAGYAFNVPNWTGFLAKSLCEDSSTDNGIIYNTGGATIRIQNSNIGTSSAIAMVTSGPTIIKKSVIGCTWNAGAGTNAFCESNVFNQAVIFAGDSAGQFNFCRLIGGASAAYTHSTTGEVDFSCCIFDSSHVPCIAGAGVGVISVSDITFLQDGTFAALPGLTGQTAWMPSTFGTTNHVFTSNGAGVVPSFKAPTAGAATTVVAGFNNVLSAADTTVQLALDTLDDFGSGAGAQTVNLYTGAAVKTVTLGSTNTTSATTIQAGSTGLSLTTVTANGPVTINSGTGTIGIGTSATANIINFGTGAGVKAITIGNVTSTTAVNINTGTAGSNITTTNGTFQVNTGTGAIRIGTDLTTKAIQIGNSGPTATTLNFYSGTGGIGLGTNGIAQLIVIGNATGITAVNVNTGTAGTTHTTTNGIFTLNTGTGTISLGTDAVAKAISIGNVTGATGLTLNSGTNGITVGGVYGYNAGSIATIMTVAATGRLGTATVTAGAGISVTPGANTITIAATGGAGFTWSVITADQGAVAGNGYICNKAGLLTLTLPAVSAAGDYIRVAGMNTALGWKIAQNAGNTIHFNSSTTTPGVGGYLASSAIYDSVELVCLTANTLWSVVGSSGNITIV